MTPAWVRLCRGDAQLAIDGDQVVVTLSEGRLHRVHVRETDSTFEFNAISAGKAMLKEVTDLEVRILRYNRIAHLNGGHLDRRGRLCVRGWVAKAGLSATEFRLVLHRVAAAGDRLEFLITGSDTE